MKQKQLLLPKIFLFVIVLISFSTIMGMTGYLVMNKQMKFAEKEISNEDKKELKIELDLEQIDISKLIYIPEEYREYTKEGDLKNVRNGYIIADKKIADIDGDGEKEIVVVIETKIGNPRNQRLVVLDKLGDTYRDKFDADFNNLEKIYNNNGVLKPKLEIKDIDNDGFGDILYLQGDDDKEFSILNIFEFVDWDKGSFNPVLRVVGFGMSPDDFKDLDNDNMSEIKVYNNIFKSNVGLYLDKGEHKINTFNVGSEMYRFIGGVDNRNFPAEIRMSVARWPDIYKWDGSKYYLANDNFPDEYMDFIKNTQKILENSDSGNGYFEDYRQKALSYQKPIALEALPGDGVTNMARKAISQFSDKFYGSSYLDNMQKLYAEDYLKLKFEKKFNRLRPGDKIEFPLNLIDEAILKARKLFPLFSCGISMIKDIDGNIYNTVQIGSQCWMKENLQVSKNPKGDKIRRYCYDDFAKYCDTDGALYDWNTAMNNSKEEGAQGICPDGWHIPKDSEWYGLEKGLTTGSCSSNRNGSWDCDSAGTKLGSGGSSGFEGLFAGIRQISDVNGPFSDRGRGAFFWSSTERRSNAWNRFLSLSNSLVYRNTNDKKFGLSVRCLKD